MYSNSCVEIIRQLTQIVCLDGILDVARGNQQMLAPNSSCSLDDLLVVGRMYMFTAIVTEELITGEVGCNIVEGIFGDLFLFHSQCM